MAGDTRPSLPKSSHPPRLHWGGEERSSRSGRAGADCGLRSDILMPCIHSDKSGRGDPTQCHWWGVICHGCTDGDGKCLWVHLSGRWLVGTWGGVIRREGKVAGNLLGHHCGVRIARSFLGKLKCSQFLKQRVGFFLGGKWRPSCLVKAEAVPKSRRPMYTS